jgi:hypothetical protein
MLRRAIAGSSAGLLLAGLLVSAAPASARHQPWGSTSAENQKLRKGCRYYPYTYRVTPPVDDWVAELFLVGPRGGRVASAAFDRFSDPAVGRARWRICRPSVVPGRFKIKMKVTYLDGYDLHEGWVAPSYFRLSRRR